MATAYDIRDVAIIENTFTDAGSGAPTDPSEVRVKVRDPQNEIVTYTFGVDAEVENPSTGVYRINLLLTKPGRWFVRFEGPNTASEGVGEEYMIVVRRSQFYDQSGNELPDTA